MVNENKIRKLLDQTAEFIALADEHEDEGMLDINHNIYDKILDELGVEGEFSQRDEYYEVFAEHHFGMIDNDQVLSKIKSMRNNP